jgi:hypothetical protein
MTTKTKTPEELAAEAAAATAATVAEATANGAKFEADDKPPAGGDDDGDDTEDKDMEAASVDVAAIVKAIKDKSIPVGAMEELLAAIQEAQTEVAPETDPAAEPAPPGAEAMKNAKDATIVSMQAVIDGLVEKDKTRDAEAVRKTDVDAAFSRLKDRPLGADLRGKLDDYHAKFGAEAFKVHVDTLAQTFGAIAPTQDPDSVDFRAQGGDSEAVMKFAAKGEDVAMRARKFSRIWKDLHARGQVRQSEERYIEVNMAAADLFTVAR